MNVWCSKDKSSALTSAKLGNAIRDVVDCRAPVKEHYLLGQSFGITGTPAIILNDSSLIPGYQSADNLKNNSIKCQAKDNS